MNIMKISVIFGVFSVIILALPLYYLRDVEVTDMFNVVLTAEQQKRFLHSHYSDKLLGDCYEDPSSVGIRAPFDESSQVYEWIRCKRPFVDMNVPENTTYIQSVVQQKEFIFFYMANSDYMMMVLLTKFGYSNVVQVTLINKKDRQSWKRHVELPVVAASHLVGPFFKFNRHGHRSPIAIGHCIEMPPVPLLASDVDIKFCVQDSGKLRLDAAVMLDGPVKIFDTGSSDVKTNINHETGNGGRVLMKAVAEVDLSPREWESLNFVWPVGPRRASVVHKSAGIPVAANTIALSMGNMNLISNGSEGTFVAGVDYSRGLISRKMMWDWTTASFYTPELPPTTSLSKKESQPHKEGETQKMIPYGFHFSRSVYDYIITAGKQGAKTAQKNVSAESVFFYNGKMMLLNEPLTMELLPTEDHAATILSTSKLRGIPRENRSLSSRRTQHWRVTSRPYSDALDLIFTPADLFYGNAHLILCNVDYYLLLGTFSGVVPGPPEVHGGPHRHIKVSGVLGVVEEMDALW